MEKTHETYSSLFRGLEKTSRKEGPSRMSQPEPFCMFTIDFDKNHRPIPECMMKNTLKEIVKLAMASPHVTLDTSPKNLRRVWAIKHPDKDNNELREKVQALLKAEAALQEHTVAVVPSKSDAVATLPENYHEEDDYAMYFERCDTCTKVECVCYESESDTNEREP
ncbi:hypothetical protein CPC16_011399 [Podila verticillata]|nr:hypothetical protein CPC16_011399 [Podila verticillata]